MMTDSKNTLKTYALRHTDCRESILEAFLNKSAALSHGDLESLLQDGFDRVTIYRTLKTFVEKGILHKIPDDEGGVKYALCKEECSSHEHHHDHIHFKCSTCGDTTCLESVHIPAIRLPEGYVREDVNMLVQGICPNCISK